MINSENNVLIARISFFNMVSEPIRHSILEYLLEYNESTVNNLVKILKKPQTLISYHLHCLNECGLLNKLKSSKDGRKMIYSIHEPELVKRLFQLADDYLFLHKNCQNHQACQLKKSYYR